MIIDPALAVVKELEKLLQHMDEQERSGPIGLASGSVLGKNHWRARYFVSGDPGLFRQVGNTLLQEPIDLVEQVIMGE